MTTFPLPALVAATKAEDDRETWLEGRLGRVTASVIHDIAVGGRSTHLRILGDMLNGSKFKGNDSTRRGHVREDYLVAYAAEFIDPTIIANRVLFVHPENERIGATPDGLGADCGVEVKSLDFGADADEVPGEHYDQMQLGMYVTGRPRWLYIREVMGEDGEPTLDDPTWKWIERDDRRIEFLVREAERFLAWKDAGAPATDDIPAELDDALARWADARSRKQAAESDEKAEEKYVRAVIAQTEGALDKGLKLAGRAAQFVYTVTDKDELDEEAWAEAEPEGYAGFLAIEEHGKAAREAAAKEYTTKARSTRLVISATKEAA